MLLELVGALDDAAHPVLVPHDAALDGSGEDADQAGMGELEVHDVASMASTLDDSERELQMLRQTA